MSDRIPNTSGQPHQHSSKRKKCSHKPTSQSFRFVDLPLELRQQIYRLCLVDEAVINFAIDRKKHLRDKDATRLYRTHHWWEGIQSSFHTSLLLTNSTIHQEAAPILYGLNTFQFYGQHGWRMFIKFQLRLMSISRSSIRRLGLKF